MAEHETDSIKSDKEAIYDTLASQMEALLDGETDAIANMGNFCAAIHDAFDFHWTGFYLVNKDELVLGPFQGPVACTRITRGKGVCGTSWETNSVLNVPDVEAFPGHIACSPYSRSELVLPFRKEKEVLGVLDIDSSELAAFSEVDIAGMQKLLTILESHL